MYYEAAYWSDLVKILTTKPRHASSFFLECTDFKNARGRMTIDVQISSKPKTTKILNENL